MTDHIGTLCIDLYGLTIDTEATFAIDAEWDGRHLIEAKATLLTATIDGYPVSRDKIVHVLRILLVDGDDEVAANEDREAGVWLATAERDARDNHADSRAWVAE